MKGIFRREEALIKVSITWYSFCCIPRSSKECTAFCVQSNDIGTKHNRGLGSGEQPWYNFTIIIIHAILSGWLLWCQWIRGLQHRTQASSPGVQEYGESGRSAMEDFLY